MNEPKTLPVVVVVAPNVDPVDELPNAGVPLNAAPELNVGPEVVVAVALKAVPELNMEPDVVVAVPLKPDPEPNVELEVVVLVEFVPEANTPNPAKYHQNIDKKYI